MINEVSIFAFIIYLFNPFNNSVLVISRGEKISFFIFALIGLSTINWNLFLNMVGIRIPMLGLLYG
jgi:hypothetical protein